MWNGEVILRLKFFRKENGTHPTTKRKRSFVPDYDYEAVWEQNGEDEMAF